MFLIGLTGGIASGKSTVATMFKDYDVPVVDADVIARRVVLPGRKAWQKIREEFGEDILLESGEIDRDKLGKVIFNNKEKRKALNLITHPDIQWEMFKETVAHFFAGHQYIILDLPLLFEAKVALGYLEKIVVVYCESDVQLSRLLERSTLSESDAKARISAQLSLDTKCSYANFVIENSGSMADTRKQVERINNLLRSSNAHWWVRGKLVFMLGIIGVCLYGLGYVLYSKL